MEITYKEHIDVFNFIDNLSNWYPGLTSTTYQDLWSNPTPEDIENLKSIKRIRKKYYYPNDSIFIKYSIEEDILADSFYTTKSFEAAMNLLKTILSEDDYREFSSAFIKLKFRAEKILAQINQHSNTIERLNRMLMQKKVKNYYKKANIFYNAKSIENKISIFAVSRPIKGNDAAFILNDTIILKLSCNDNNNSSEIRDIILTSIIMHELMHNLSMNSLLEKKLHFENIIQNSGLATSFLSKNKGAYFIEEPLAVILGQKIFIKKLFPKYYDFYDNVYVDPWIRTISMLVEHLVEQYLCSNISLDEVFIAKYLEITADVIAASYKYKIKNPG